MNRYFNILTSALLLVGCTTDNIEAKPNVATPPANINISNVGAINMPYTRYDSADGILHNGAVKKSVSNFEVSNIAAHASNQEYVELPSVGSAISWRLSKPANGVTIRFNIADNTSGDGQKSVVEFLVNDKVVKELTLDSYWSYQYFTKVGTATIPMTTPQADVLTTFVFDENHTLIPETANIGDLFTVRLKNGAATGVDFVELEAVDAPRPQPSNSLSVLDFGAKADDGIDDLDAFNECIATATAGGKIVYIPEGVFTLNNVVKLERNNIRIEGAGMWHTTLYFNNNTKASGGFFANAKNLYVGHLYCNTINSARFEPDGQTQRGYKCIGGTWRDSKIEHLWQEHFTVGAWLAGYQGESPTNELVISNSRLRNNYADGLNFAHGTSNSTIEHSNIRNCGDDGLASFSSCNGRFTIYATRGNTFRNNTVDFVWRASGVGIFGGEGHTVENNLISECIGSSGIRFTSTFEAHPFNKRYPMVVKNNIINKCGSRQTVFGTMYGAFVLTSKFFPVEYIKVDNLHILNSYTEGIKAEAGQDADKTHMPIREVEFSNVRIIGTAKDNQEGGKNRPTNYKGAAIYTLSTSNSPEDNSLSLSNIIFEDCESGEIINSDNSFNISNNE